MRKQDLDFILLFDRAPIYVRYDTTTTINTIWNGSERDGEEYKKREREKEREHKYYLYIFIYLFINLQ
jgi:hypothetical protein